jgi:CheY-like chemotaxis protein
MIASPPKVLVVDDDEFVRINLVAFLEDEGLVVHSAAAGEEGLDILEREDLDVAVVDMRLPGMDGNTFILTAHRRRPGLGFVIHTGSIDYQLPEALRNIGLIPGHVFHKPVPDMNILLAAILDVTGAA